MKRFLQIFIAFIIVIALAAEFSAAHVFAAEDHSDSGDGTLSELSIEPDEDAVPGGEGAGVSREDTGDVSMQDTADASGAEKDLNAEDGVSAASPEEPEAVSGVIDLELMQEGALPQETAETADLVSESGQSFEDYIRDAIENREEIIDLSGFELQPEEAAAAISEVINGNPLYFFLSGEDVPVTYDAETGVVSDVELIYTMDESEIRARRKVIDDELAKIRAFVDAAPDGELDRVLAIHEYFALNYCYDDDLSIFGVDELMMYKQGVCQAFALAFELVCGELGIESGYASGYQGAGKNGHAWNSVMVDGQWYMIDTTWDSQSSAAGYVSRVHLLKSQSVFGHGQYDYNMTYRNYTDGEAVDTTYNTWWWNGIAANTALYPLNENWYYLKDHTVYRTGSAYSDATAEIVFSGNEEVRIGSAMCVYGGRIWFAGAGAEDTACCNIYSMAPDGSDLKLEFTAEPKIETVESAGESGISEGDENRDPDQEGTEAAQTVTVQQEIRGLGELFGELYYSTSLSSGGSTFLYMNQPVTLTGGTAVYAESIAIDPAEVTLSDEPLQLAVVTVPAEALPVSVYWKSSDNSVAQVDDNGLVTAVGCGTAVITAVTRTGNLRASAAVTVPQAEDIGYNSVFISSVSETEGKLFWTPMENAERYYIYQVTDDGNSQTNYRYSSYELLAVTEDYEFELARGSADEVLDYCIVAANANGRTKAYYTAVDGYIRQDPRAVWKAGDLAVTDVTVSQGTAGFKVGDVYPAGTDTAAVSFTALQSDDPNVVYAYKVYKINLDAEGNMLPGKATLYGTSEKTSRSGFAVDPECGAVFFVETYRAEIYTDAETGEEKTRYTSISNMSETGELRPEGIAFYDVPEDLYIGEEYQTMVEIVPDGTEIAPETLKWSGGTVDVKDEEGNIVKDENGKTVKKTVFDVKADGTLTGVNEGTATLYVYTSDKAYGVKCTVTVYSVSTERVSLNKKKLTLDAEKTQTLKATVFPLNATNKNVTWKSSNTKVAKVSAKGKVTALKAGTSTITVTTEDGAHTASCKLTVTQPVTGVKINKTALTLTRGKSYTLKATVAPANATNKNVKWSSSDKSVVTVSSTGRIKALKAGTATITVRTLDGSFKARCKVTVKTK